MPKDTLADMKELTYLMLCDARKSLKIGKEKIFFWSNKGQYIAFHEYMSFEMI